MGGSMPDYSLIEWFLILSGLSFWVGLIVRAIYIYLLWLFRDDYRPKIKRTLFRKRIRHGTF